MEILILGGILVALMVYASTRIKRSAAGAYEGEVFETDDFSITKPEGFIIIESEDAKVLFAAYSKEYGTDDADSVRQVTAQVKIHRGQSLERIGVPIKENAERVLDERHIAGPTTIIETGGLRDGVPVVAEYQLFQKGDDTYELSVEALPETKEANQQAITTFLSSFELK